MIGRESSALDGLGEAERVAVLYAPKRLRPRFYVMLLLDAQLARIALTAREPMLAQLKLAWWRDTIAGPARSQGHPLAQELETSWPEGREPLSGLVDAWEDVAAGERLLAAAQAVAGARSAAFAAAARAEPGGACASAALRWTLVALAVRHPGESERENMLAAAREIGPAPLPRDLRPLALLDGLARRALERGEVALLGDRLSPLAALRLGIFGR